MMIMDPMGPRPDARTPLAPAPPPRGRIGVLGNGKPRAEELLLAMRAALAADGYVDAPVYNKTLQGAGSGEGAPNWVYESLAASADLVLLGSGDCGGCSTWSILDAVELERRGVATVTLCTDIFVPLARNLAASSGIPDLPLAVLAHPLATRTDDDLYALAPGLAAGVRATLAERPTPDAARVSA